MTDGKPGRSVNRADLATLVGISLPTVDGWVRRGCPYVQRGSKGREWRFDSASVIAWLRQQDVEQAIGDTSKLDYDEARRRKTAAEAALAEIELGKARRAIVLIDDVTPIIADEYAAVRGRVREIPARLSQRLAHERDAAVIERALRDEIDAALEELTADAGIADDRDGGA